MLVKNAIRCALLNLDRSDIVKLLDSDSVLEGEAAQTVNALMHCYNAVEDELARLYFPLTDEYTFEVSGGGVQFKTFPYTPIKIINVKSGGKAVKHRLTPTQIKTAANKITVKYCYSPSKKTILDECEVREPVSERLISYGIAAEYSLICGLLQNAEGWESKYREEISAVKSAAQRPLFAPQRSWV